MMKLGRFKLPDCTCGMLARLTPDTHPAECAIAKYIDEYEADQARLAEEERERLAEQAMDRQEAADDKALWEYERTFL